ncbi:Fe-S cluster assembly protein SufD [Aeoliella mucimassa]|uniref:FeS cluster assembly protein SufB n=1 Tax=Aeoliella mucimassa TaxID=2527972 RepID=A0A518AP47_9BACT|nr:Fe-S cluster assembly protein SufD [Aeoliella mucimassa]QDU56497.1 FeS cluster assembly protein SufB [Aeoliella mucimassa]
MTAALEIQGFTKTDFEAFLAARPNEPAWLVDMRRQAWDRFEQLDWPARNDEEWMRTDIRMFHLNKFALPIEPTEAPSLNPGLLTHDVDLGGQLVGYNSQAASDSLSDSLASTGVLFGSLDRLVCEYADLLRPFFERHVVDPAKDKFAALHAACWSGGTLLYVPKGVAISEPLHALSALGDGGTDLSKTLVILDDGAEATLLTETASTSPTAGGLHCGSIELIVEPNAKLRYVNLQNWSHNVWHFAHQRATVDRNGSLQWTIGALGSKLAKVNQQVALTGPDADIQVNGVMFTEGRQHLSYNTHQHHMAPYCRSDLLYKSALQDRSRTVWRGMIKVDVAAQRTDAYQRNDNLMLASTARADSIPGLEIEADDVRCTHGSTSGRVDEQQVFYAMTRGYTRTEAIRLIVAGFFQQVFDRITIESVRNALGDAIARRVQDLDSAAAPQLEG